MPFHVTVLYAGLNGLLLLVLVVGVMRQRLRTGVQFGAGGSEELERAQRCLGNWAEYVPLALILMGLLEAQRTSAYLLHALGIAITVGRVLHAWGLSRNSGRSFGRSAGMVLTWAVLLVASVVAVVVGLGLG
jgi:uncharacterized membrane protein YecN with MAPEG domain